MKSRWFPAAAAWALALAALSPDSLSLREGCDVVLRRTEHGFFEGGTVGTGRGSNLRGAAHAHARIAAGPEVGAAEPFSQPTQGG